MFNSTAIIKLNLFHEGSTELSFSFYSVFQSLMYKAIHPQCKVPYSIAFTNAFEE